MTKIHRRDFNRGLAAASLLGFSGTAARAQAPVASVTARLTKKYAGATLKILWGTGTTWEILARNTADFTEASGIKLDFTMAQYMDRYTKMMLDLTTGSSSFDIYPMAYQWKYDAAPYLADLSKIEGEVEGAPPLDIADYPQRPLAVYSKVEDKLVSLPVLGDVTFLIWNKAQYAAAGIDAEAVPKTWTEVIANGKKLTKDKQFGFGMPAGKNVQTATIWMQLFNANGGKYVDDKGQPQLNSKAGIDALNFIVNELQPISPPGNLTWDFTEVVNSFVTGQAGQALMWPAGFGVISDPAKSMAAGKFGWAVPPGGGILGGHGAAINGKSRNVEAAKLFAAWLTSKEIVMRTAHAGAAPVRTSALSDAALIAKYPHYPAVAQALAGPVFSFVPLKEAEQIHRMIFDEVNSAVAKTKTVEKACEDMQAKVADFIKRRQGR